MGIDSYFFVGNFIRVPGVKKAIKNPEFRCSKGCSKKPEAGARFCSQCGAPVENRDNGKVELVKLNPYDMPGGNDDEFFCPEYCAGADKYEAIWIPNSRGEWGQTFSENSGDEATTLDLSPAEECEAFATHFKNLLEYIEMAYGVKPQVCWGVVPYAS